MSWQTATPAIITSTETSYFYSCRCLNFLIKCKLLQIVLIFLGWKPVYNPLLAVDMTSDDASASRAKQRLSSTGSLKLRMRDSWGATNDRAWVPFAPLSRVLPRLFSSNLHALAGPRRTLERNIHKHTCPKSGGERGRRGDSSADLYSQWWYTIRHNLIGKGPVREPNRGGFLGDGQLRAKARTR